VVGPGDDVGGRQGAVGSWPRRKEGVSGCDLSVFLQAEVGY
jgi:hypothetical protein